MKHTKKTYRSPDVVFGEAENSAVICQSPMIDVGNESFEETYINW